MIAHAGLQCDGPTLRKVQAHLDESKACSPEVGEAPKAKLHRYTPETFALGKEAFATDAFSTYTAALQPAASWK